MTKQAKDCQRLRRIIDYCEKIKIAAKVFNDDYETFADDRNYQARDVCSFYILQIGELVSGLTDDFKAENSHIPWRAIKGMRNVVVHKFEFCFEILWKCGKDYLLSVEGLDAASPKKVIRFLREAGIFDDAETERGLAMADDRNMTAQTYDEALAKEMASRIRDHTPLMCAWLGRMTQ